MQIAIYQGEGKSTRVHENLDTIKILFSRIAARNFMQQR